MKIFKMWKGTEEVFESDIENLMKFAVTGELPKKEVLKMLKLGLDFHSLGAIWSFNSYIIGKYEGGKDE